MHGTESIKAHLNVLYGRYSCKPTKTELDLP